MENKKVYNGIPSKSYITTYEEIDISLFNPNVSEYNIIDSLKSFNNRNNICDRDIDIRRCKNNQFVAHIDSEDITSLFKLTDDGNVIKISMLIRKTYTSYENSMNYEMIIFVDDCSLNKRLFSITRYISEDILHFWDEVYRDVYKILTTHYESVKDHLWWKNYTFENGYFLFECYDNISKLLSIVNIEKYRYNNGIGNRSRILQQLHVLY